MENGEKKMLLPEDCGSLASCIYRSFANWLFAVTTAFPLDTAVVPFSLVGEVDVGDTTPGDGTGVVPIVLGAEAHPARRVQSTRITVRRSRGTRPYFIIHEWGDQSFKPGVNCGIFRSYPRLSSSNLEARARDLSGRVR